MFEHGRERLGGTAMAGAAAASAVTAGTPTFARVNWFPRWQGIADGKPVTLSRRDDGYIAVDTAAPTEQIDLDYSPEQLEETFGEEDAKAFAEAAAG